MIKTTYQTPEIRNANDQIVQQGAFGKNTPLSNSTNDGWIDYVVNNLEAIHDTVGDSAATLDGNGHVVEPANRAIGDEDGNRIKTTYLKTTGGTVAGTLRVKQNLKVQDNQENVFGGIFVPSTTSTQQFIQLYAGETPAVAGVARLNLYSYEDDHSFRLTGGSTDGSSDYVLRSTGTGDLTWRGHNVVTENNLPTITTGSANGTIKVGGTDVAVKGLQGFAYQRTQSASFDKGTIPESTTYPFWISFLDRNGTAEKNRLAGIGLSETSGGYANFSFVAYKNEENSTANTSLGIVFAPNGENYAYCPTPPASSNSNNIATTEWANTAIKSRAFTLTNTNTTSIAAETDLNNLKTAGTYICASSTIAGTLLNSPVTNVNFKMVVSWSAGSGQYLQQIIYVGNSTRQYIRALNNNVFTAWEENITTLGGMSAKAPIHIRSSSLVKGTPPSSEAYPMWMNVFDSQGSSTTNRLASFVCIVGTNGNVTAGIASYKNNSGATNYSAVYLANPLSGDPVFRSNVDNSITLGVSTNRWKQLYAATTTIATSDERLKDNITDIPDEVLDAWGEVGWYQYQFKDSIAEKGGNARIHTGAIAQRIESVFNSHGLDASRYGLLCYDSWDTIPAEKDDNGNIITPQRPADYRYSLRYEEALCMEAAYQRRRADRLEERIARLEALVSEE